MTIVVTTMQQGRFNFYSYLTIEDAEAEGGYQAGEQRNEVGGCLASQSTPLTTGQADFYSSLTASDIPVIIWHASVLLCGPSPPLCLQHLNHKKTQTQTVQ